MANDREVGSTAWLFFNHGNQRQNTLLGAPGRAWLPPQDRLGKLESFPPPCHQHGTAR